MRTLSRWFSFLTVGDKGKVISSNLHIKCTIDLVNIITILLANLIHQIIMHILDIHLQKYKFHFIAGRREYSLQCEVGNLVKLMEFQRIQSSYFANTFYLQNLYNATFLTSDKKRKTFVVLVNESEVYRYIILCMQKYGKILSMLIQAAKIIVHWLYGITITIVAILFFFLNLKRFISIKIQLLAIYITLI